MKEVNVSSITEAVKNLCVDSNFYLGSDVIKRINECYESEESPTGREVLAKILENIEIGKKEGMPLCQDTGYAVFFVKMGQNVRICGGNFVDAVNEGVRRGYKAGYLRNSVVTDPLERKNSGDNTPAIIYTDIVPGDDLEITIAPKGGGSENMSEVRMMAPAAGVQGVKDFVIERVRVSGANPCPPVIVGVGIGGTFEKCAQIAKKSLLRPVGSKHPNPFYADLEQELLTEVNKLGIGPQGFGGRCTALAVHIEVHPCHIASFPVAVNMQCHVARHKTVTL